LSGAGSGDGNATISFGAYGIRSVSFTFGNGSAFPSPQDLALFSISFTPVPEVNPATAAGIVCGLVVVGVLLRRRFCTARC
jgi:hypothetical protein